ncbi:hypothetical protein CAL22_19665 [Bordetella genomosp. 12]|uniref:DUF202 domain-containing protein n=1 Tax=Bordetella genomosp. 12 TaxID=463035 RepID=A0A261VDT3_9BORD|nr:hypothetical protein CAL22_19665 [Bordetella genomosp. 12]
MLAWVRTSLAIIGTTLLADRAIAQMGSSALAVLVLQVRSAASISYGRRRVRTQAAGVDLRGALCILPNSGRHHDAGMGDRVWAWRCGGAFVSRP